MHNDVTTTTDCTRCPATFIWPFFLFTSLHGLFPGETPNLKVLHRKTISRSLTQVKRRTVAGKAAVLGDGKAARRTTSRQIRAATWKIFPGRPLRLVSTGENRKYGTAGVSDDKRRKTAAHRSSRSRSVLGLWWVSFAPWKQRNC